MKLRKVDLEQWVNSASPEKLEFRQAVHTTLLAIGSQHKLSTKMAIKGGMLLAIKYNSDRFTRDIDFSTSQKASELDQESVRANLEQGLIEAIEKLDYGLDCRIQSFKIQPSHIDNPTYPELRITIGFAYKGSRKHKRLLSGKSTDTVKIDYSLNEPIPNLEWLDIGDEEKIIAYSFADLIAEKYRAFLQQSEEERNRQRRQDIYDLYLLLKIDLKIDKAKKKIILDSLLIKSKARNLNPNIKSIDNPELIKRAKNVYPTLSDEVEGKLPEFDKIFSIVSSFYKSLPWS